MKSLTTPIAAFLIIAFFTYKTSAEVLRWPQVCANGNLEVSNSTTSDINAWLQKFSPQLSNETNFLVKARSTVTLAISSNNPSDFFSIFYFEKANSLKATLHCDELNFAAHSFEGGILTYRKSNLDETKLWIQNLFTDLNTVKVEFLNRGFQIVGTDSIMLTSMQQLSYKVLSSLAGTDWAYVRVQGAQRFAAFNLTTNGSEGPFLIDSQKSSVSDTAAYFVVGSRDNSVSDQFIVRITDAAMIAKARQQIADPSLEKIIFATVQKGHGGFNRNWSKKDKSFWSWSATEVTNIADLGSTACNGFPQAVEDRMDSWLKNPGQICFWSYRIKKELNPSDVASGQIPN